MVSRTEVLTELEAARDRFAAQGSHQQGSFGYHGYYCAIGAIHQGVPSPFYSLATQFAAGRALSRTLVLHNPVWLLPYGITLGGSVVAQWHNDNSTFQKVVRNFDRTIARYERVIEREARFEPTRLLLMGKGWIEPIVRNRRGQRVRVLKPVWSA